MTRRSQYTVPKEFIDSRNSSISQEQLATLLSTSYDSITKWIKEVILGELKPLFLRIQRLDDSKKNFILQDFFTSLFPTFANNNREKLIIISKDFRKTYNNWRNILWKKILERYTKYKNKKEVSEVEPNLYLQNRHINDIFHSWLKYTSGTLTEENENALKNLIVFGFYCIKNYSSEHAHDKFFSYNGSLYTINCDFPSSSGYNIATSMDLSKYDTIFSSDNFD